MLSICQKKKMTEGLVEHDLCQSDYPFSNNSMDHAVFTEVTHLFEDLNPIFKELSRIIKPGGSFSFVVADSEEGQNSIKEIKSQHHSGKEKIRLYRYSQKQIQDLMTVYGFKQVYDLHFQSSAIGLCSIQYHAYVTMKSDKK